MTSKMTSEKCNEPTSEELCGSGRKFQLLESEVQLDRVQHGQTSCLLLSLCKCCQVANAPYERIHLFEHSNHTCAQQ